MQGLFTRGTHKESFAEQKREPCGSLGQLKTLIMANVADTAGAGRRKSQLKTLKMANVADSAGAGRRKSQPKISKTANVADSARSGRRKSQSKILKTPNVADSTRIGRRKSQLKTLKNGIWGRQRRVLCVPNEKESLAALFSVLS